jgi:hypothetical protein
MSDGGKGSKPRPFSVTQEQYDNRWNMIFQKDLPKEEKENPLADKVVEQIEKSIEKSKK